MFKKLIGGQTVRYETIESDDEYPDDFVENQETPAYLIPNRFDNNINIQFPWLSKKTVRYFHDNQIEDHAESSKNNKTVVSVVCNEVSKSEDKLPLDCVEKKKEYIIKKQDLMFLKMIVDSKPGTDFVLWFLEFLVYKDLQYNNKFLQSCLVQH